MTVDPIPKKKKSYGTEDRGKIITRSKKLKNEIKQTKGKKFKTKSSQNFYLLKKEKKKRILPPPKIDFQKMKRSKITNQSLDRKKTRVNTKRKKKKGLKKATPRRRKKSTNKTKITHKKLSMHQDKYMDHLGTVKDRVNSVGKNSKKSRIGIRQMEDKLLSSKRFSPSTSILDESAGERSKANNNYKTSNKETRTTKCKRRKNSDFNESRQSLYCKKKALKLSRKKQTEGSNSTENNDDSEEVLRIQKILLKGFNDLKTFQKGYHQKKRSELEQIFVGKTV